MLTLALEAFMISFCRNKWAFFCPGKNTNLFFVLKNRLKEQKLFSLGNVSYQFRVVSVLVLLCFSLFVERNYSTGYWPIDRESGFQALIRKSMKVLGLSHLLMSIVELGPRFKSPPPSSRQHHITWPNMA